MNEIIQYIIQFLLGDHVSKEVSKKIGYTSDEKEYSKYKLVIKPSDFFDDGVYGTEAGIPTLPLKQCEGVPILFGEGKTETVEKTQVVHADIVAGTYFLISRYEEMVKRTIRDAHKRFPGTESLPYKAGFIDRPIIEEWGELLRSKLRETGVKVSEPPQEIRKVYLTHDVDQEYSRYVRRHAARIKTSQRGKTFVQKLFRRTDIRPLVYIPLFIQIR